MKVDVVTIFPQMVRALASEGVVGRACEQGVVDLQAVDLREFTDDAHRTVDDAPFGGGPGMVLKAEPFFRAVDAIAARRGGRGHLLLASPQGRRFTQRDAERLSAAGHLTVLCGRYEGIDERVSEVLAAEEFSIGDYVLSGGELPAMVLLDAVVRLVPDVVGDARSVAEDSFSRGLLDYPHYTRPAICRGHAVPSVLLSGHHRAIAQWRKEQAIRRTLERRPDLIATATLDDETRALVEALSAGDPQKERAHERH